MADIPYTQLLGVVDQLAPWRLVDAEGHLLGGELQQWVYESGRNINRHDTLLVRVLAYDGVTYQSLLHIVRPAQDGGGKNMTGLIIKHYNY